jgi:hypothetical protein
MGRLIKMCRIIADTYSFIIMPRYDSNLTLDIGLSIFYTTYESNTKLANYS